MTSFLSDPLDHFLPVLPLNRPSFDEAHRRRHDRCIPVEKIFSYRLSIDQFSNSASAYEQKVLTKVGRNLRFFTVIKYEILPKIPMV